MTINVSTDTDVTIQKLDNSWYNGNVQYFVIDGYSIGYVGEGYTLESVSDDIHFGISTNLSTPSKTPFVLEVITHCSNGETSTKTFEMINPGSKYPVKFKIDVPEGYQIDSAYWNYQGNTDNFDYIYENGWFIIEDYVPSNTYKAEINVAQPHYLICKFDNTRGSVYWEDTNYHLNRISSEVPVNLPLSGFWILSQPINGCFTQSVVIDGKPSTPDSYGYVYVDGGANRIVEVTFVDAVLGIELEGDSRMVIGDFQTITYCTNPSDAVLSGMQWSSSDPGVLTVDSQGQVTAVGSGTATVTLCANNKCSSLEITVLAEHTIFISVSGDGIVSASHRVAVKDTEVTITPCASEWDVLSGIAAVSDGSDIRLNDNGDGTFTFVMPDADIIVNVEFVAITHDVTFFVDGAEYMTISHYHGDPLHFAEEPSKDGHMFIGWFDDESQSVVSEGIPVIKDMVLYAVFEPASGPSPPEIDPMPPYQGDDSIYIPPNIVVEKNENDNCYWIFIVLGSVATFLFLLFAYFDRRDKEE